MSTRCSGLTVNVQRIISIESGFSGKFTVPSSLNIEILDSFIPIGRASNHLEKRPQDLRCSIRIGHEENPGQRQIQRVCSPLQLSSAAFRAEYPWPEQMDRKMLRNVEKRGVQAARIGPSPPPTPAGGPVAQAEIRTADRLGSRQGSSRAPA